METYIVGRYSHIWGDGALNGTTPSVDWFYPSVAQSTLYDTYTKLTLALSAIINVCCVKYRAVVVCCCACIVFS